MFRVTQIKNQNYKDFNKNVSDKTNTKHEREDCGGNSSLPKNYFLLRYIRKLT